MLREKMLTSKYPQDYCFEFKGQKYRVHSVVKLKPKGQKYLDAVTDEAVLIEQFTYPSSGKKCWKYQYRMWGDMNTPLPRLTDVTTDVPPEELIKEVIAPATYEYASRQVLGQESPEFTKGVKHIPKDSEIPEIVKGWVVFILVFIVAAVFKDWYIKAIIRVVAAFWFGAYRKTYKDLYSGYTYPEDKEILKKTYEIQYGVEIDNKKGE